MASTKCDCKDISAIDLERWLAYMRLNGERNPSA